MAKPIVAPSIIFRRLTVLVIAVIMKTRYNWDNKDCAQSGLNLIKAVEDATGGSITEGLE